MESIKLAFEVIASPFNGFKKLKEKKAFLVPFLLAVVLNTVAVTYYTFNVDLKYVVAQQIEMSGKMDAMPKEQVDKMINIQSKILKYAMPTGYFLGAFFYLIIIALYLFTMAKVYTSDLSFKESIVITGNAYFVFFISAVTLIIILFVTDFKTSSLQSLMPTNLAYYFSYETLGRKLYIVFSKIDLFSVWFVSLLGIGFHVFTEESLTKSLLTVFVPYILLIILAILTA